MDHCDRLSNVPEDFLSSAKHPLHIRLDGLGREQIDRRSRVEVFGLRVYVHPSNSPESSLLAALYDRGVTDWEGYELAVKDATGRGNHD